MRKLNKEQLKERDELADKLDKSRSEVEDAVRVFNEELTKLRVPLEAAV